MISMKVNPSGEYEPFHVPRSCFTNIFRIKNPLPGISKAGLFNDVERYTNEHGVQDALPYLRKGALVAQNPDIFESIEELDEEYRQILRHERTRRWSHPKAPLFHNHLEFSRRCNSKVGLDWVEWCKLVISAGIQHWGHRISVHIVRDL